MDQFAEQLSKLAELGDEEVAALEAEIVAAFDEADTAGDIETMSALADNLDEVRAEVQRRSGTAPDAEADSAAEAAAPPFDAQLAASAATAEAEAPVAEATDEAATNDDNTNTEEAPASEADSAPEAPQEEDMEELDATDVADEHQAENLAPATVIKAGGDIKGFTAGAELNGMDDVVAAMTSKVNDMRNISGGNGEQLTVASLRASAAETRPELALLPGDPEGNAKKIRSVMADQEAITAAANGWCAPRTPRYEVYGVGTTDRPVRDSLPGFNADRGGILYMEPPVLSYPTPDGVGIWEFDGDTWGSEDIPGGTVHGDTKVVYEVECGEEKSADLYAITTQLKFTNMLARAYPEWVRRNTELSLVAQARTAETVLLTKMFETAADVPVAPTPSLGAARDALVVFTGLGESIRNRHRIDPSMKLDVWAPAWWRAAMALDIHLQQPGDQISNAKAEVDGYLDEAGLNVTWFLDDVIGEDQLFTSRTNFPAFAAVLTAPPGSFLYLDGGTLDLGVVRDETLVGTNKYIEFAETFEGVANIGFDAQKVIMPVGLVGGTACCVDTSGGVTTGGS